MNTVQLSSCLSFSLIELFLRGNKYIKEIWKPKKKNKAGGVACDYHLLDTECRC